MVQKQLFFTILSAVIVAALLSVFSVTQGLFFTPQFDIDISELPNNSTQVIMKNVGWAQAKNAVAFIDNAKKTELITDTCYEGSILKDQRVQYLIKFEKMSTNIDCSLFFNGKIKPYFYILVVADDAPGKSWSFQDQLDNSSFILFTLFPIALGVTIALAITSTISLIYRVIVVRKRQESFKSRELQLVEEIKSLQQERHLLQSRQGTGRSQVEIEKDNKRLEFLDEQISEISSELDEIRTKMVSDKKTERSVGEFYTKWALLEREIVKLALKHDISSVMARINSGIAMKKLFENGIITSDIYSNFQNIRRFRNNIAHGITTPINKELETQLANLETLLTKIQDIIAK